VNKIKYNATVVKATPRRSSWFLVLGLASCLPAAARAQTPPPVEAAPVEAAQLAAPAPAVAPVEPTLTAPVAPVVALTPPVEQPKKDEAPKVSLTPGKGVTFTSADNRFSVNFKSREQIRETVQHQVKEPGADVNTNELNVKTLRLYTSGHVLVPELKFTIQLAFGPGDFDKDAAAPASSSPIFDAFIEYVKLRDLNVRFGQYFVPFDRGRTIREFALQFVDRQTVVRELTLDRDVGLMLSSQDIAGLGGRLGYHVFVGGGEGRNRVGGQVPGPLVVGRFVVRPMGPFDDDQEGDLTRSKTPHMAIGVAAGYNHYTNRAQSTFGTVSQGAVFSYTHAAADLVFKGYGFSLLAEGVVRTADQAHRTVAVDETGAPLREWSRSGWGYFVQGGQMLTDKLEVTARWDDLHAKKNTDPKLIALAQTQGRQVGGGLNYYLNGHALKLQADYFYIFGTENTDQPLHAVRAQIDASF
jgi:hypothetical protein